MYVCDYYVCPNCTSVEYVCPFFERLCRRIYQVSNVRYRSLIADRGRGGGGLQNGKNAGPKLVAPNPLERVDVLAPHPTPTPPPLRDGIFLRPIHHGYNFRCLILKLPQNLLCTLPPPPFCMAKTCPPPPPQPPSLFYRGKT